MDTLVLTRVRWSGHVVRMVEIRITYRILVGSYEDITSEIYTM